VVDSAADCTAQPSTRTTRSKRSSRRRGINYKIPEDDPHDPGFEEYMRKVSFNSVDDDEDEFHPPSSLQETFENTQATASEDNASENARDDESEADATNNADDDQSDVRAVDMYQFGTQNDKDPESDGPFKTEADTEGPLKTNPVVRQIHLHRTEKMHQDDQETLYEFPDPKRRISVHCHGAELPGIR
jgi:hypothetical protein